MNVWILTGIAAHDTVVIGVFKTKELAEIAKEMDGDYYAFYNIRCWGVTQ